MRDEFWLTEGGQPGPTIKILALLRFYRRDLHEKQINFKNEKADAEETLLNIGLFNRRFSAQSNP